MSARGQSLRYRQEYDAYKRRVERAGFKPIAYSTFLNQRRANTLNPWWNQPFESYLKGKRITLKTWERLGRREKTELWDDYKRADRGLFVGAPVSGRVATGQGPGPNALTGGVVSHRFDIDAGTGEIVGGFDADALGLGAEGMLTDPTFFEFVPPVFLPATDRFAGATMDAWSQEVLGRRLRDDERARALAAWRASEKTLYASEVRRLRAEHARDILGQSQAFPGGKDIPASGTIDPLALAPGEQPPVIGPSGSSVEEAKRRTRSFTQFTEADFELALRDAIAAESPVEEFGVELREGFEGFMAAIRGRVSAGAFAP